jgi:hypothetical protein
MPPQSTFYDFLNPPIGEAHDSIDSLIEDMEKLIKAERDKYPIPTIHWHDKYENWKKGFLEEEEKLEMERPVSERKLMSSDALKDLFKMVRPAIEEIYEGMGYEDTSEAFDSLLSKTDSGTILSYLTDRKDPALKSEYEDERLKKLRTAGRFNPAGGIIGEGKNGGSQYVPLGSSFSTREDPDTIFAGNTIQNILQGMDQSYWPSKDFVGPMPRYRKSNMRNDEEVMAENLRSLLHETRHIDPITGDILPHGLSGRITGMKFDEEGDKIIMDRIRRLIMASRVGMYNSMSALDIKDVYRELGY